jgi:hypothetical protein
VKRPLNKPAALSRFIVRFAHAPLRGGATFVFLAHFRQIYETILLVKMLLISQKIDIDMCVSNEYQSFIYDYN